MCVGLPMQVRAADAAWAEVEGRGEWRRVRTALVGAVAAGDWLLVHLDSAVERLTAARAAEIDAALDLLQAALGGALPSGDAGFELPSAQSAAALARLTGQSPASGDER
ncbi:HypC/HybG/HupF family hydrogenase formation chaperone [Solimonas flava]|uniref:HypC/HybG/HupF family hydrogenase formation chaperone n=1 Tax=Solimonas flava TaxID=415849 RepID=UPI0003FEF258|nr:HypC/HybG/HupF family hydrogenase formation chaperone [Solimonas flava]